MSIGASPGTLMLVLESLVIVTKSPMAMPRYPNFEARVH